MVRGNIFRIAALSIVLLAAAACSALTGGNAGNGGPGIVGGGSWGGGGDTQLHAYLVPQEVAPSNVSPIGDLTTVDEKVLIGLEYAAISANSAAILAVETGVLEAGSEKAVKVADTLLHVRTAVGLARQAYNIGNTAEASRQAAQALTLLSEVSALIPRR